MEISGNLSKQPLSTGPGRIKLKKYPRDHFRLLKSPNFRLCRFLDVMVLIRGLIVL